MRSGRRALPPVAGPRWLVPVDALTFAAELWCVAEGTWRFVTLPEDMSDVVRFVSGPPRGFGSVRVEVTIGATTWRTSVFPSAGGGPYVLPVKAAVRRAEDLEDGETVAVTLRILNN